VTLLLVEVRVNVGYFGIALPPTWAHEAPLTLTKAAAITAVSSLLLMSSYSSPLVIVPMLTQQPLSAAQSFASPLGERSIMTATGLQLRSSTSAPAALDLQPIMK